MKYALVLVPVLLLGCGSEPIGEGAASAVKACLDNGWEPRYFSNAAKIDFTCLPPKTK